MRGNSRYKYGVDTIPMHGRAPIEPSAREREMYIHTWVCRLKGCELNVECHVVFGDENRKKEGKK